MRRRTQPSAARSCTASWENVIAPFVEAERALNRETVEEAVTTLWQVGPDLWDGAPKEHSFGRSALWRSERALYLGKIEQLIRREATIADELGVTRVDGTERSLAAELHLGDEPISLVGKVDRVDTGDGLAVIVDYKSGREIKWKDVEEGRRLQLQLYAALAQEQLGVDRIVARYSYLDETATERSLDSNREEDAALIRRATSIVQEIRDNVRAGCFPRRAERPSLPVLLRLQKHLPGQRVHEDEAVELTAKQQAIVDARGEDVLVSAGAGTGKTHTLVERYVSLLEEHGIAEIVAITFTDAAAAEMRDRVRRTVMERDDLAPHRPELDRAIIGTIHSLCLEILREFPVEAGIDPGGDGPCR